MKILAGISVVYVTMLIIYYSYECTYELFIFRVRAPNKLRTVAVIPDRNCRATKISSDDDNNNGDN